MKSCQQLPLLLCLTAVVAINTLGINAARDDKVKKLTKPLQVIPYNDKSSTVTKLVITGSQITLNETDRWVLKSYPRLVELHLDGNLVTSIPARYFSVVPQLKVLSLSRNKISRLDPESFSGLDFLTVVDLSHNLLTSLHTQLFRRLNKLQVWNLQENPWNCSCPLWNDIGELRAAGVGGPKTKCASLDSQDGRDLLKAVCTPSTTPTFATDPQKPPTAINFQQATMLNTTMTSQNHINKDQAPVLGNTWKFTVCVVALALCTCMLILCGIKGPSWYKLLHNYRHRRLHQEEEEEDAVSTVYTETRRYRSHQTFTFEQENGRIEQEEEEEEEEEEDGYFEDPYIKREE